MICQKILRPGHVPNSTAEQSHTEMAFARSDRRLYIPNEDDQAIVYQALIHGDQVEPLVQDSVDLIVHHMDRSNIMIELNTVFITSSYTNSRCIPFKVPMIQADGRACVGSRLPPFGKSGESAFEEFHGTSIPGFIQG